MTESMFLRGVGQHPTPPRIVSEMAARTVEHWSRLSYFNGDLRLLDLFAGDGRLGLAATEALRAEGLNVKAVFVEISETPGHVAVQDLGVVRISENVFEWDGGGDFDVVVCNPPYERIGTARAESLGIPWAAAKSAGYNLYGMGILRAIDACRLGGITVAIAPFGWLSGSLSGPFRKKIASLCSEVHIYPENSRSVFPGVHQDIAVQVFVRRQEEESCAARFFFSGRTFDLDLEMLAPQMFQDFFQVRVGPLVWNRSRELLTDSFDGTLPVVYGGCITSEGRLDLGSLRFQGRRRVYLDSIPRHFVSRAPAVLIRRVMRGGPGAWKVDSSIVRSADYVVENHVIGVELLTPNVSVERLRSLLIRQVEEHSAIAGSPSLSVRSIKQSLAHILGSMNLFDDGDEGCHAFSSGRLSQLRNSRSSGGRVRRSATR